LGLIASLAGLTTPVLARAWFAFDMLSHFELHYAIGALAFAIGLVLPVWRFRIALALCLLGVAAIGGWTHWKSDMAMATIRATPTGGDVIRVMTFNTWLRNSDWRSVIAEIEQQDPDIVTLMEFGGEKSPALEALKKRYPYTVECLASRFCHMALFSRFPINNSRVRTSWEGPPVLWALVDTGKVKLNVFGVHTLRAPHYRAQMKQIVALARLVRRTEGPKLVMGDFNATPFSRVLKTFGARSHLDRLTWLPSWPSYIGLPQLAIDHIFVSPGIAADTPEAIGRSAGSDHYPVIMDLRLATPSS